jgi:cell wall assembly regulator SMI1
MTIVEEVKKLAREALRDPAEPVLPEGASDQDIAEFESRTGLIVPLALREWLKFTNGPGIGAGGVRGIRTPHPADDIERCYDLHAGWKDKGWIPIAGDGCGNYYVIVSGDAIGSRSPVFFINRHSDPMKLSYIVASDLWRFLRFYLRRDLGERGWPFDREKVLLEDPVLSGCEAATLPWEAG